VRRVSWWGECEVEISERKKKKKKTPSGKAFLKGTLLFY
jgi:hypothetical protein